ncbi:MAG: zf-HC2 domain-containing protein [Betaproteobacteria bacterium]|jgi:predicted anti-sigma-YlaC factor YlaD|nr:zf-HC2 domain-containing protein [Betaproteobacteria bacterium]
MSLTCKETARLLSEGLDRDLPPERQALLRAHLAICRGCDSLRERMTFLRRAMRRAAERDDGEKP